MRIIGIDPGVAITGYAIIDIDGETVNLTASGSVQTLKNQSDSARLFELFNDLSAIIEKYKPDKASVEKLFYCKNQKTIIPVAQARGTILTVLEKYAIPLFEYTPMQIKLSVTGYGKATKNDVADMCKRLIQYEIFPKLDDSADAVAAALCLVRSSEV